MILCAEVVEPKNLVVVYNDFTDADNLAAFVDILLHAKPNDEVHIIMHGRRANLSVPITGMNEGLKTLTKFTETENQGEEWKDSLLVYRETTMRCISLLDSLGLLSKVTSIVMDPEYFVTKAEPVMSHFMHALDFAFGRGDLYGGKIGDLLNNDQYYDFVNNYNVGPSNVWKIEPMEERRLVTRSIIQDGISKYTPKLKPISFERFACMVSCDVYSTSTCFLLGPLTNATSILEVVKERTLRTMTVYGQLFAENNLNPKTMNIFKNQFNVDADQNGTIQLLHYLESNENIHLYISPTEATKDNAPQRSLEKAFMERFGDVEDKKSFPVMQNYLLYTTAKKKAYDPKGTVAPEMIFDIGATMLYNNDAIKFKYKPVQISHAPLSAYEGVKRDNVTEQYLNGRNGDSEREGFLMETVDESNIHAIVNAADYLNDCAPRFEKAMFCPANKR